MLSFGEQTSHEIGKYGRMHLDYLKQHRLERYTSLLTEGKLNGYLHDVDEQAHEQIDSHIAQMAKQIGVGEELKAFDPMRCVQLRKRYSRMLFSLGLGLCLTF